MIDANADGHPELEAFWRHAKSQEQENIDQLKKLIQCHFEAP
jgi:thymidylate synthase